MPLCSLLSVTSFQNNIFIAQKKVQNIEKYTKQMHSLMNYSKVNNLTTIRSRSKCPWTSPPQCKTSLNTPHRLQNHSSFCRNHYLFEVIISLHVSAVKYVPYNASLAPLYIFCMSFKLPLIQNLFFATSYLLKNLEFFYIVFYQSQFYKLYVFLVMWLPEVDSLADFFRKANEPLCPFYL